MISKINPEYAGLEENVKALPATFASEGRALHDGRNKVKAMQWGETEAIVKKYKKPNFFLKLQFAFLNNCKAKKAYRYALLFNRAGLRSPEPVAYAIVGKWPIIRDSYFICMPAQGACLRDILTTENKSLISKLAKELLRMHKVGLMHGDLNLSNIYSTDDGTFTFIDTNRTKIRPNPSMGQIAENMMRLTHDRALLSAIAHEYADLRGWDAQEFASRVIGRLEAFQRKKARLKRLKAIFGIH